MSRDCAPDTPPPAAGSKRPRLYYATQVAIEPPTFVFFASDAAAVHFSYRRYLENRIRAAFGFAGTPIRLRMTGESHGEIGICNRWRLHDDWWREPVARVYFKLVTRDGLLCTVFLDEHRGTWHLERIFD